MLDRRQLGKMLAFSGLLAATGGAAAPAARRRPARRAGDGPIKPPRLAAGDTVGLVLPASLEFEAHEIDYAREQLEALGFRVAVGANVRKRYGYLAGTDAERVADLHDMFARPEVKGIFCYRGGWGTPRLLPLLDFDLVRANPKALIGYSDITALLNAIHQETGLVTFHGPAVAGPLRPYNLEHLRRAVFSTEPIGTLANPPKEEWELAPREYRTLTLRGGRARGRVVGGNLTMLSVTMGTPWEVDTEGAILFLEDVNEELYRVDRMLTQLQQAGKLAAARGVVFGHCTRCGVDGPSLSLEEILREKLEPLGVPVLSGFAVGHIQKMVTLPIGLEATLDADAGTLTYDEAAVV